MGQGEQEDGLTDKADSLHDDGFDEGGAVFDRVDESNKVRHIPHQEKDTHTAKHGCAGHALQLEGWCVGDGVNDEHQGTLHIEEKDDGDEYAGEYRCIVCGCMSLHMDYPVT